MCGFLSPPEPPAPTPAPDLSAQREAEDQQAREEERRRLAKQRGRKHLLFEGNAAGVDRDDEELGGRTTLF